MSCTCGRYDCYGIQAQVAGQVAMANQMGTLHGAAQQSAAQQSNQVGGVVGPGQTPEPESLGARYSRLVKEAKNAEEFARYQQERWTIAKAAVAKAKAEAELAWEALVEERNLADVKEVLES